jgi:uncharacterized membrane protein YfcA
MSEIIIIITIGLCAGVLAGMFGIGGGVVMVPALILAMHFTLIRANGTSLAALMMPVGILAVIAYYRENLLDIKVAAVLTIGLLAGVLFGAKLALALPTNILKQFYGLFLLWVSWNFFEIGTLFKKRFNNNSSSPAQAEPDKKEKKLPFYFLLPFGVLAGVLSGMFGIGGGLVMVPMLVTLMNFNPKKAVGTSLGALLLPVALPGVLMYYNAGQLNIRDAAVLAAGLVVGSLIGAKITISLPVPIVKRVYAVFLLIMSVQFIVSGFK